MEYHLKNWSVIMQGDPYTAPELFCQQLVGLRDDDPREVITSRIVSVQGRRVTTYSGSVYILDEINPEYLSWIKVSGYTYDPENPIKDKRK